MDRELVTMVGAGMQLVASGLVGRPPDGSIQNGHPFVEHLVMFGNSGLDAVVVDTVAVMWRDWLKAGLPRPVAEEHIAILPELLEIYRIEPSIMRAMLGALDDGKCSPLIAADNLTAIIIGAASHAHCFEDTGLNRQITFFFVERLLSLLLQRRSVLQDLEVAIDGYFSHLEREAQNAPPNAPETGTDPSIKHAGSMSDGIDVAA